MFGTVFHGALIGLGATFIFDLWQGALTFLPRQAAPDWAPVGRWFWHLREGRVFHENIMESEPFDFELPLGWLGHYAVGLVYGVIFVLIVGDEWLANPTFLPAWAFGLATVAFGWFLLQPGLGLGWAASRTPDPTRVRLMNLAGHTVFGLGLWLTALVTR